MKIPQQVGRACAVILSLTMFVVVVAKAQGCQRPVEPDAHPTEPLTKPEPRDAGSDSSGSNDSADLEPDAANADVGREPSEEPDVGAAEQPVRRNVFPATKAGPVRIVDPIPQHPLQKKVRKQQNQKGKTPEPSPDAGR